MTNHPEFVFPNFFKAKPGYVKETYSDNLVQDIIEKREVEDK